MKIKIFLLLSWILLSNNSTNAANSYCIPQYTKGCKKVFINFFKIYGTSISVSQNSCDSSYKFVGGGSNVIHLYRGIKYKIGFAATGTAHLTMAFDANRDSSFSAGEILDSTFSNNYYPAFTRFWTLPITADTGLTILRVTTNAAGKLCTGIDSGQTIDYRVYIHELDSMSTPKAGKITDQGVKFCPPNQVKVFVFMENMVFGSNYTYQWQKSINQKEWTNVGDSTWYLEDSTKKTTYYRCMVGANGQFDSSNSIVFLNDYLNCYCKTTGKYDTTLINTFISYVKFPEVENGNKLPMFFNKTIPFRNPDYTNKVKIANLNTGIAHPFEVSIAVRNGEMYSSSTQYLYILVDLDHDNVFSSNEKLYGANFNDAWYKYSRKGNITIPNGVDTGVAMMRIILSTSLISFPFTCLTSQEEQIEDYLVHIDSVKCSGLKSNYQLVSTAYKICPNVGFQLGLTDSTFETNTTFSWQYSDDGSTWNAYINTNAYSIDATIPNARSFRCVIRCGNDSVVSSRVSITTDTAYRCMCKSYPENYYRANIGFVEFGPYTYGTYTSLNDDPGYFKSNLNFLEETPKVFYKNVDYTLKVMETSLPANYLYDYGITAYIDLNRNFIYESPSEQFFLGHTNSANKYYRYRNGIIKLNDTLSEGFYNMRIILNSDTSASSPCVTTGFGQTMDLRIKIANVPGCAVGKSSRKIIAQDSINCSGSKVFLTIDHTNKPNTNKYQWQSSFDLSNWVDLPEGKRSYVYAQANLDTQYIRCIVQCNQTIDTLIPYRLIPKPVNECYCIAENKDQLFNIKRMSIDQIQINKKQLSKYTYTTNNYYYNLTNKPSVRIQKGVNNEMNIMVVPYSSGAQTTLNAKIRTSVFIDYNKDGDFDDMGETVSKSYFNSSNNIDTVKSNFVFSDSVKIGVSRMRILVDVN
ncbi:MAG: hypothetical protein HYZ42_05770, partial [Bacteroidetes bacterium]|nr:hypothetical protein [Bacteroidota bacterium]